MSRFSQTDLAMAVNNKTFIDYLDRLKLLATSIFTWKNLDEVCGFGAECFLETALFEKGRACFVKDDEIGLKVLYANPCDKLNTYNLPTEVEAWSITYNKRYPFDDVVYVMNNILQKPTLDTVNLLAYRLYETERTIDINLNAQKTPILIEGDTKSILTLKNVYEQYSGNIPFIFGNKSFELANKLNAMKTDAPYIVDKLTGHKKEIMSEFMNFVGIDNFFSEKKERLITAEAEGYVDLTNYYLNTFFKTRQEACKLLNEKFLKDSDIKVELTVNREEIKRLKGIVEEITETKEEVDG